jgi:hypothetical protein
MLLEVAHPSDQRPDLAPTPVEPIDLQRLLQAIARQECAGVVAQTHEGGHCLALGERASFEWPRAGQQPKGQHLIDAQIDRVRRAMFHATQIGRLRKDEAIYKIGARPGVPTAPAQIIQHAAATHDKRPLVALGLARPLGKQQWRRCQVNDTEQLRLWPEIALNRQVVRQNRARRREP